MKVHVPIAICLLSGIFMLVQFFVPHHSVQMANEELLRWARIVAAFTLVLGISSLARTHWDKIRRRRQDWGYSVVTLVSFVAMIAIGMKWQGLKGTAFGTLFPWLVGHNWGDEPGTSFAWVYDWIFIPLDATMFSLLAFFMASAAYRTFRARTPEATVLLLTALVVMLGRVPLGDMMLQHGAYGIWAALVFLCIAWAAYPWLSGQLGSTWGLVVGACIVVLPVAVLMVSAHLRGMPMSATTEWIMSVPSTAAKRGILFGVALGSIATSLRIIFGVERSHLGG